MEGQRVPAASHPSCRELQLPGSRGAQQLRMRAGLWVRECPAPWARRLRAIGWGEAAAPGSDWLRRGGGSFRKGRWEEERYGGGERSGAAGDDGG